MVSSALRSLYTTVYSQVHAQEHGISVAGTNEGKLLIYDISSVMQREEGSGTTGDRPLGPVSCVQASSQSVYSLLHTKAFLVSGTTGVISGWRWSELTGSKEKQKAAWSISLESDQSNFGTPEVNSLAYDGRRDSVWAACGDWKTRAYDINTGKQTHCLEGHKDYVHKVVAREGTVITGGEDGRVLVWDGRTNAEPHTIIQPADQQQLARPHLGKFVSCVDYAGGEWLVCGGGPRGAVFHLRSRGLITPLPPADQPITVTNFTAPEHASSIVTAASDGNAVYVCNLSGQVTAKLPTSARCVYTVAVSHDKHTLMSIGGCGNKIDMCLNLSYRDHVVTTDIEN